MGDHLIVLHSAVRACAGYSRHDAPSILLDGSSIARGTEHGRAVTAQLTRRHGTLEEAIAAAVFALHAAGLPKGICRQARAACEDYFYSRLDLTPGHEEMHATCGTRPSRGGGGCGNVDVLSGANPLDEIAAGRYEQMMQYAFGLSYGVFT